MGAPRLLLLLGQFAFDPASGAAQSMRQAAELLANRGWLVQALTTSACETDAGGAALAALAQQTGGTLPDPGGLLRFERAGVLHHVVRVAHGRDRFWEADVGARYEAALRHILRAFRPQVCLTYGGGTGDAARRALLRKAGVRVVFALHNLAYITRHPIECDAFLAPSEYLAGRYRAAWSVEVAVLPTPLTPAGVMAERHEPIFVVFVNPEPAKGVALVARLAARLGMERPDIPLLVVEGRAKAGTLLSSGQAAGLDLSSFENLMFAPCTHTMADIWGHCRILLVPSFVEEAAGRVVIEAMANGAVPLVSDRGALPETLGEGGIVLPLPADLPWQHIGPIPLCLADPWFETVCRLVDDESTFVTLSAKARRAAARHLPERLGPLYDRWFRALLPGAGSLGKSAAARGESRVSTACGKGAG